MITNPQIVAIISGVIGLIVGVLLMSLLQRRRVNGQSIDELRQEFEDYREKVSDHFSTTSDLFTDMTEKYREVYNHLAAGSEALCEDPMKHGRLEFTEAQTQIENQNTDRESNASLNSSAAKSANSKIRTGSTVDVIAEESTNTADEIKIDPSEFRSDAV